MTAQKQSKGIPRNLGSSRATKVGFKVRALEPRQDDWGKHREGPRKAYLDS